MTSRRPGSDTPEAESQSAGADSVEPQRISIGSYLAQQRRLRGITPEGLAELTRIPLRSIERLESGQFDDVVDGFVRGFVRTVAEALGLDPGDTVARMLDEPSVSNEASGLRGDWGLRVAVVAAAVVVLVAVVAISQAILGASDESIAGESQQEAPYRRDAVRALAEATQESASAGVPRITAPHADVRPTGSASSANSDLPVVASPPPESGAEAPPAR